MRSSWRVVAAALGGFSLLTLAVFRPSPSELAHTAPAFRGSAADALLLMWATSHVSRALFSAPLHLFDAGIFYPLRHTLAFGDHMIGEALIGLPLWLATGNPLLEYNVLVLTSYALGATAAFVYAREQTGGVAPAVAAGIAFAFTPFRFHSPLWLQVLFTAFVPLALCFWLRFVRTLRWQDWVLWVACWVLHSLMGLYLALYFALTMTALAALALVAAPTRRAGRLRAGMLLGPLAMVAAIAPTLWPYLALRGAQGTMRTGGLDTGLAFFLPGSGTLSASLAGWHERVGFGPGVAVWMLALLGVVVGRRRARDRFAWAANLAGLGVTLALILTPIRLQLALPGLDMVRNTNRAFHVSLAFLAFFVAQAVAWLQGLATAPRRRAAVGALLVLAVAAEMGLPPGERKRLPFGHEIPPAYGALARLPDRVVYDGRNGPEAIALGMYYAIFHRKAVPTGYSGFSPPAAGYVTQRLFRFPEDDALVLLDALGIRHVLWHFATPAAADAFLAGPTPPSLSVAGRFGGDVLFTLGEPPVLPPVAAAVHPIARAGWRLTASAGGDRLPALVDGDPRSAWAAPGDQGRTPWMLVDLGRSEWVAGVRCAPTRPDAPAVPLARVELSEDGEHWERVPRRFVPDSLATLIEHPAQLAYYEVSFPARQARYVRLVNPELAFWGGTWDIAELDVMTPEEEPER